MGHNLKKLEDSVRISSSNFVDDRQRPSKESLVGGLANVSELSKKITMVLLPILCYAYDTVCIMLISAIMTELSRELLGMHRPGSDTEGGKVMQ